MTTLRYLASSLYIDIAALTLPDLDLELDLTSAVAPRSTGMRIISGGGEKGRKYRRNVARAHDVQHRYILPCDTNTRSAISEAKVLGADAESSIRLDQVDGAVSDKIQARRSCRPMAHLSLLRLGCSLEPGQNMEQEIGCAIAGAKKLMVEPQDAQPRPPSKCEGGYMPIAHAGVPVKSPRPASRHRDAPGDRSARAKLRISTQEGLGRAFGGTLVTAHASPSLALPRATGDGLVGFWLSLHHCCTRDGPLHAHIRVITSHSSTCALDLLSNAGAFARSHRWHPSARARLSLGNIVLCLPSASGLVTVHALVSVAFEGYLKVWTAFFLPHDCMDVMRAWGLMRPSVPVTSAVAIEARRQLNRWCSMEDVLIRYCGALATLSRPWSRLLTLSDDHWAPVLLVYTTRPMLPVASKEPSAQTQLPSASALEQCFQYGFGGVEDAPVDYAYDDKRSAQLGREKIPVQRRQQTREALLNPGAARFFGCSPELRRKELQRLQHQKKPLCDFELDHMPPRRNVVGRRVDNLPGFALPQAQAHPSAFSSIIDPYRGPRASDVVPQATIRLQRGRLELIKFECPYQDQILFQSLRYLYTLRYPIDACDAAVLGSGSC
ncbi:hypothetical protein ONZ51_g2299 [Trametes cubensis]|uniref:Uncharacterized protein n=1 Tax=Trametes cubensis TaxID=1111947 RepID=A0AAD7TZZ0_9APHY|nr:hypothetical protein ONZ51_g2299 [Trametes cubensis]